jgi:hypothetical protein
MNMNEKYCPAGKIECEWWELKTEIPFLGVFNCIQTGERPFGYEIYENRKCPWPSRQLPVNVEPKMDDEIAAEIADMPFDEFKKNCDKIVEMCKAGKDKTVSIPVGEDYLRQQYIAWFNGGIDAAIATITKVARDVCGIEFDGPCSDCDVFCFKDFYDAILALKRG